MRIVNLRLPRVNLQRNLVKLFLKRLAHPMHFIGGRAAKASVIANCQLRIQNLLQLRNRNINIFLLQQSPRCFPVSERLVLLHQFSNEPPHNLVALAETDAVFRNEIIRQFCRRCEVSVREFCHPLLAKIRRR